MSLSSLSSSSMPSPPAGDPPVGAVSYTPPREAISELTRSAAAAETDSSSATSESKCVSAVIRLAADSACDRCALASPASLAARAAAWQAKAAQEDAEAPHLAAMFPFLYSGGGGGGGAQSLMGPPGDDHMGHGGPGRHPHEQHQQHMGSLMGSNDRPSFHSGGGNGAYSVGGTAPRPPAWGGPPSSGPGTRGGAPNGHLSSSGLGSYPGTSDTRPAFERERLSGPPQSPWLTHGPASGGGQEGRLFGTGSGSSLAPPSGMGAPPDQTGGMGAQLPPPGGEPNPLNGGNGGARSGGVLPALRALRA
jgi:hypothetical protein